MSIAALLIQLLTALPGEYAAISAIIARVRATLSESDQAAVDAAVEAGFQEEQAAVAQADAALS